MEDLLNAAYDLSQKLFHGADQRLLDVIDSDDSKDVYLTIPDVFISLFERALYVCEVFNFSAEQMNVLKWLTQVNIYPSVDWAISLYYKDYAHTKEKWMIRKIPITSTIKTAGGNYSKEIVDLNELITLSEERVALN